jgi:acyl-CoA thioesterase-2
VTQTQTYQDLVDEFAQALHVEPAGDDRFVGQTAREPGHDHEHERVFGGLVLGQAALAAGRTAPDPTLHSLHAYFLRGGRPGVPIDYHVERVRDGRTFTARRVLVRQSGDAICDVTASFVHPEDGISHQDPMPDVPAPETLRDSRDAYPMDDGSLWPLGPIEWRAFEPYDKIADPGESTVIHEWFRVRAPLPEDPQLHTAALVMVSDMGSFGGIERRYGWQGTSFKASGSLDHAIWVHRPVRWDGWMLMVTNTPVAHAARPLTYRQFYTRDGTIIASMAQEAIFRRERASAERSVQSEP